MTTESNAIRIFVPLKIRRRNGRPRILPPDDIGTEGSGSGQDPHLLRAIARAWDWQRRLETGAASTLSDIAQAEQVPLPFVSR